MEEEEVVPHHHTVCELTNNTSYARLLTMDVEQQIYWFVVCMCQCLFVNTKKDINKLITGFC